MNVHTGNTENTAPDLANTLPKLHPVLPIRTPTTPIRFSASPRESIQRIRIDTPPALRKSVSFRIYQPHLTKSPHHPRIPPPLAPPPPPRKFPSPYKNLQALTAVIIQFFKPLLSLIRLLNQQWEALKARNPRLKAFIEILSCIQAWMTYYLIFFILFFGAMVLFCFPIVRPGAGVWPGPPGVRLGT
jgi:hypothetical protein